MNRDRGRAQRLAKMADVVNTPAQNPRTPTVVHLVYCENRTQLEVLTMTMPRNAYKTRPVTNATIAYARNTAGSDMMML